MICIRIYKFIFLKGSTALPIDSFLFKRTKEKNENEKLPYNNKEKLHFK